MTHQSCLLHSFYHLTHQLTTGIGIWQALMHGSGLMREAARILLYKAAGADMSALSRLVRMQLQSAALTNRH